MEKPICLFDSGLGGLTVLKKLIDSFPNENYIYLADFANVPFGDKSKSQIKEIAINIIEWLNRFNPKTIIMACNTSSTLLSSELKAQSLKLKTPIFGMIESIAKEIANSGYSKVSVWATKLAVDNNGYQDAIHKFNPNIKVEQIACSKLVPMIEDLNFNQNDKKKIIKEYLDSTSDDSEALILGCTHYPLIQSEIKELSNIKIIDPADALVSELKVQSSVLNSSELTLYATAQVEKLKQFAKLYLMSDFTVKEISIKPVPIIS